MKNVLYGGLAAVYFFYCYSFDIVYADKKNNDLFNLFTINYLGYLLLSLDAKKWKETFEEAKQIVATKCKIYSEPHNVDSDEDSANEEGKLVIFLFVLILFFSLCHVKLFS